MTRNGSFRTNSSNAYANERSPNLQDRGQGRNEGGHEGFEPETGLENMENSVVGMVHRNPLGAVMTVFGLGLGFGLGLTLLLPRREQSWFERNMPDSIQHLPERLRRVPDSFGTYIPSAWKHS
jgi:hypothetical protein